MHEPGLNRSCSSHDSSFRDEMLIPLWSSCPRIKYLSPSISNNLLAVDPYNWLHNKYSMMMTVVSVSDNKQPYSFSLITIKLGRGTWKLNSLILHLTVVEILNVKVFFCLRGFTFIFGIHNFNSQNLLILGRVLLYSPWQLY